MNNGISAGSAGGHEGMLLSSRTGCLDARPLRTSPNPGPVQKEYRLNYWGQKCIGTIAVVCSTTAMAAERNVFAPSPHRAGSPLRRGCVLPRSMWKYRWYDGKRTEMMNGKITGDGENVERSYDFITIFQYKSYTLMVSL